MLNTHTSFKLITRDIERSMDRVEREPTVKRDIDYYVKNITKVKSIDDFLGNDRLFRFAMKAHGLSDMTYAKAFIKKALTEGINSPGDFANKLSDPRYREFVRTYNFERYGELATSYNRAQHDAPKNFAAAVELGALQAGFGFVENEVTHYVSNISGVTSIDDLLADKRILNVALGAFGLDAATETPARIREMLEGGVTDPNSPANKPGGERYKDFVSAFNFVEHGAATTGRDAVQNVPKQFMSMSGLAVVKPRPEYVKAEVDYYKANIGKVESAEDLLADKRLLRVALSAYGLDADAEDPKRVRTMLAGGVADPDSPANKLADKSYAAFVTAFNFVEHGAATTARDAVQKDALKLYSVKSELGLVKPNADYVAAETAYYRANIVKLESIDELMADKRLLDFALAAYGLNPSAEAPARVRQMLEGGVTDPKSPANQLSDEKYLAFVTAFNFAEHGELATVRTPAVQSAVDLYTRQTLEENAGKDNEGVRLALYFQRKAPEIDDFYEVLADPALARVVRTALSLPDSFASANIDKQVALFEQKLNIADFGDAKKLTKFLDRFTSLWELGNPSQGATSPAAALFGRPAEFGVSGSLLLQIQSMRR